MQRRSLVRALPPLAVLAGCGVLLTGCGGGGSGEDPAPAAPAPPPPSTGRAFAYVPNFSSEDITVFEVADTGLLTPVGTVPAGVGPKAVVVHPSRRFAYAVNEEGNSISVYTVDPETGMLTPAPTDPVATGAVPIGMQIHPSGNFAYVNHEQGISILAIDPGTGVPAHEETLEELASAMALDQSGMFLLAGLGTQLSSYAFDVGTGGLELRDTVTTSRHITEMALAPSGRVLYVTTSESIDVYVVTESGEFGASTTTEEFAHGPIAVDPAGRFVCAFSGVSERVASVYIVENAQTGALNLIGSARLAGGGMVSVAIAPSGRAIYVPIRNRDGGLPGAIATFGVDLVTGTFNEIAPQLAVGIEPAAVSVVDFGV